MKIVVLDGYALNPGDLSWTQIEQLGSLTVYERTPSDKILERAQGAEIIFTNKTPLTKELLNQLPSLKYIGVLATGYNVVDIAAAAQNGIIVTNIPAYSTYSVAQLTFALLLELCHHVQNHSNAVHEGAWVNSKDFSFWNFPLTELTGKTFGVIGFGSIGQQVAVIANAFGMKVLAYSRTYRETAYKDYNWVDLDKLLHESDVVSLHCPLTPETTGLINSDALSKMKPSAFLINTSRGPIVNEFDLAAALNKHKIAGAGLDVLSTEPPQIDNPLLSAKNCIITPHIAWATKEARTRLMQIAADNLKAFLSGNPQNSVQ